MIHADRKEITGWHRGRLIVALVITAAFAVLFAGGLGAAIHERFETRDSLAHWQARLEEDAASTEPPTYTIASDAPAARVRRLEEALDRIDGRLPLLAVAFVAASVLVVLGVRVLRRGVRVR